jgi:GNAT superfamily N-acetyltransferase
VIRLCTQDDVDAITEIINDSARAYEGHIPEDRYSQPYMPKDKLEWEIADGVVFYGYETDGRLVAVMGTQNKGAVTLIRHAYTRTEWQGQGIGSLLLRHLLETTTKPVLIGTWRDATWATAFYRKLGFRLVGKELKDQLLREYWSIPERQVETSVVLVDGRYWEELASPGE